MNITLQLFDLHSIFLEEFEDFNKDTWIWVMPPRLEGLLTIMYTLQATGFSHKARTTEEVLLLVQSLAIIFGEQTDKHVDLGA